MLQSFNKRRALRYALVNTLALVMAAPWPVLVAPKTAAAQQRPPYYQPAPYPPAPAQSPGTPQAAPGGQGTASMPGDLAGFEQPWPRAVKGTGLNLLVYQPQVEAWDGNRLELSAAVGLDVDAGSAADQHFGRVRLVALSDVDKDRGIVQLRDVRVTRVDLPTAPHRASEIDRALEQQAGVVARVVSLEQLQSSLAIAKAQRAQDQEVEVANEPPVILFSTTPAVLVLLDGEPVLRSTAPGIDRVINTNALLLRDAAGRYMLRVGGHWAEAESLQGPWTIKYANTAALDQIRDQVLQETAVDLLDDDDQPGPYGVLPDIYVSEVPAELLQTDGEPQFLPIPDTRLLYVANTASDIFVDTATQDHYVLISGRWFRARTMDGPWSYVDSASLPEDFRRIPEAHPKGGVLVSIAGTPQAQEAAIANTIPQTATIDRQNVQFQPVYDGEPQFQPVEGTPLHYAANGPVPVLRVDPHTYYAVDDGVWFTAPAPVGPWVVAEYVPPVIYTIPVYSPVHYVTYVRVYGHTPRHVHVGYTPGYLGTYVSRRGVVVYGTGYRHRPWVGRTYYAAPATYGGGAGFAAGAFTGFVLGLATAAIVSQPTWGPYRSWHYHGRHDRARGRDWRDRDGRFDGRSVARTDGRSSDQRTAAPRVVDRRTVEVSYTTNVYNTWDNRTAVRTTSVQPARTPETLRERRQQVEQLRQRSQASRERAARTRTTDPQATSAAPAPAGTAVVAAPARNDTFVDQRGNRRRGGERDGRTGARQRQAQPAATAPQPTQQQPTPQQAPPQQAAPRQAAPAPQPRTVEQQRRERQREELQRRSDQRRGRDRQAQPGQPPATQPPAAQAPAAAAPGTAAPQAPAQPTDQQRRAAEQERTRQDNARRQAEQQRRIGEENARRQAEQQRQRPQPENQSEQARRVQEENARRQAEQQRRVHEENARRRLEQEQRRTQQEKARQSEQQQRIQQENARRQTEQQQRVQQENARRQSEQQQRVQQENARRQAEQQQRTQQENARRQAEQQQRAQQENARRQAEQQERAQQEQARRQAEQQQRAQQEQARRQAEQAAKAVAEQQRAQQEQARRQAEQAVRQQRRQQATPPQQAPNQAPPQSKGKPPREQEGRDQRNRGKPDKG